MSQRTCFEKIEVVLRLNVIAASNKHKHLLKLLQKGSRSRG